MSAAATASTISSPRVASTSRRAGAPRRSVVKPASGAALCSCRRAGVGTLISSLALRRHSLAQRLAAVQSYGGPDVRKVRRSVHIREQWRARRHGAHVQRSGVAPRDAGTCRPRSSTAALGWRRARQRLGEADARPASASIACARAAVISAVTDETARNQSVVRTRVGGDLGCRSEQAALEVEHDLLRLCVLEDRASEAQRGDRLVQRPARLDDRVGLETRPPNSSPVVPSSPVSG